jgi:hypothetical protein
MLRAHLHACHSRVTIRVGEINIPGDKNIHAKRPVFGSMVKAKTPVWIAKGHKTLAEILPELSAFRIGHPDMLCFNAQAKRACSSAVRAGDS